MPPSDWTTVCRLAIQSRFPLHFEDQVMPDAKGVEGPQPRPSLLRAAAARRPIRKPGEAAPAPAGAAATATPAPIPVPPARSADRGERERAERAERADRFAEPDAPTKPVRPGGCRLDDLY